MNGRGENPTTDLVGQAFEALNHYRVPEGPPRHLVASTVEALLDAQEAPDDARRLERRKRMFRLARYSGLAAAVSILVVLGVWLVAVNGGAGTAFADVLQNVKDAKSVTIVCRQKIGRQPEIESKWLLQGDASRMEFSGRMTAIADIKAKKGLLLDHTNKIAYQTPAHTDLPTGLVNPIQYLRTIRPEEAKRLGEERVKDLNAIVYQVDKFEFMGSKAEGEMKIWVDPATELPVKIRIGLNTRPGSSPEDRPFVTVITFDQFEWNKRLDPKLFSLEAPKGYEVRQGLPGPTG